MDASDPVEAPRLGRPHRLRVKQSNFRTIISKRAKWQAHSGVLEAHAYLLALKWLARHPAKHHHRVPILVDAKAVVAAATKGRSSARALRTVLRSAAAYTMASDLLPRIVYIHPFRIKPSRPSLTWTQAGPQVEEMRPPPVSPLAFLFQTLRSLLLSPHHEPPGMKQSAVPAWAQYD